MVLLKRGRGLSVSPQPSFLTVPVNFIHSLCSPISFTGRCLTSPSVATPMSLCRATTHTAAIEQTSSLRVHMPQVKAWAHRLPSQPRSIWVFHISVTSTIFHSLSQSRIPEHPTSLSLNTQLTQRVTSSRLFWLFNTSRGCLVHFSPSPLPPLPYWSVGPQPLSLPLSLSPHGCQRDYSKKHV